MKTIFTAIILGLCMYSQAQNIGINTTTPDRPLTIQGNGINSELLSLFDAGGAPRWHVNIPGINGLSFNASGLKEHVLFLHQNGRIGINNNQPAVALHVNASDNDNLAIFSSSRQIGNISISNSSVTNQLGYDGVGAMIGTSSNHDLSFQTNSVRQITLKANGNLGIGTINPGQKFHVAGIGLFDNGVRIGTAAETLNVYDEESIGSQVTNGNTVVTNFYQMLVMRIGRQVTVSLPTDITNLTIVTAFSLKIGTLPDLFRPTTNDIFQVVLIRQNGIQQLGLLTIKTNGDVLLQANATNPLAPWNGTLNAGWYACTVTFIK
jgi:hypothetical protein